ncbi:hypothetical protein CAF53_02570 [Sphingobium sp. LB126]|nr:hypothetical protein CAF53_02570 [Sphingobium sp. LB126]
MALPAFKALQTLDPDVRALLAALLLDLQRDARARAKQCWDKHKPPMAAYWAAAGVIAGHLARVLRPRSSRRATRLRMVLRQPGFADEVAVDWADASRRYCRRRDRSGLGANGFPDGAILLADIPIGRVSYNGRIWPKATWVPDMTPIYDNRPPMD